MQNEKTIKSNGSDQAELPLRKPETEIAFEHARQVWDLPVDDLAGELLARFFFYRGVEYGRLELCRELEEISKEN